jgi:LuxR family maltose regulon positive regulatory protein
MQDGARTPLLLPKVRPPRPAARTVQRTRLLQRVERIAGCRLTLVLAPSGFGKTTLGAAWAAELSRQGHRLAWLSLEESDNAPGRFAEYLAFAVEQAFAPDGQDAGERIPTHGLDAVQMTATVINRIAQQHGEFFLFIDDLHLLEDEALGAVLYLLRHAPATLHLVLLSRPLPPEALLRACHGEAEYVDAAEMRFNDAETVALFASHARADTAATAAHRLTAGWPAALGILAASGMDGNDSMFSGRSSFLAETHLGVLLEAVLSRLQPDEIALLDATCVTGRMCAPLFADLSGIPQTRELFRRLEHVHCLLSRVSEHDHWFTCHDLVRQGMLARVPTQQAASILRRAGHWHAGQGHWREAVALALRAGDRQLALQWVDEAAPLLFYRGDLLTLREWDGELGLGEDPDANIKILLTIALTRVLAAPGNEAGLHRLLDLIQSRLDGLAGVPEARTVYWHLQAIRSVLAARGERLDEALHLSWECLQQAPIYASLTETVRCVAGYCHLRARRWKEMHEVLTEVSRAPVDQYTFLSTIYRQVLLGLAALTRLRLPEARRCLEEGHALASSRLGPVSVPGALCAAMLGVLQQEALAFDEAERTLVPSLDLVAQSGYPDVIARSFAAAARSAMLRGEHALEQALLDRWDGIASAAGSLQAQVQCAYEKMCALLRAGAPERATARLAHIRRLRARAAAGGAGVLHELHAYADLAEARHAITSERPAEAREVLASVLANAEQCGDGYLAILAGMSLADALFRCADIHRGVERLELTLAAARKAGLGATVLSQPADLTLMHALYRRHAPAGTRRNEVEDYLAQLLDSGAALQRRPAVTLSPREESVLKLLAQDKSNKEISNVLNITPETVKTHVKSIFAKLEVSKRNAAVKRAQLMQLL